MMPPFRLLLVLSLLIAPAVARAQQQYPQPDTVQRATTDTTEWHAAPMFQDTSIAYVYAVRTPLTREFVPYSVSQLRAIPASEARSLADVLHTLPGLQISDRQNYAVGERITNRGFGARTQFGVRGVKIIEDYIPLTFADGQSATESLDPETISFAEVLQGPGSALYGNAAGGVLLLHSNDVASGRAELAARGTFGSYGFSRQSITAAARPTDLSTLHGIYSHLTTEGYRAHSTSATTRADVVTVLPLDDLDALRIDGRYTEFHALSPGALTQSEFDADPQMAAASSVKANASKDGHQNQLAADWMHDSQSSQLHLTGYVIGRTVTNPIVGKITDLGRTAGGAEVTLTPSNMNDSDGKPFTLLWNAGASFALQNDDRTSYANLSGAKGAINLDQNENVSALAGFGSITWTPLEVLSAMLAARYDHTRFAVTDHYITSTDPNDSGDRTMDALSPSLGVIWRATDHLNLFTNVSTSFETPTTTELSNQPTGAGGFNPDLNPQRAIGYELGLRSFISSELQLTLTGYLTNISDELIPFEVPDAPGRSYYRNAGSARHQGLEASLHATLFDSLTVTSSFSLIDARYRTYVLNGTDFSGMKAPGIARTLLDLTAEYRAPLGFHAGATYSAVGRSFANDANTVTAPAYGTIDVRLSNDALHIGSVWGASLNLAAGIQNLLDTKYVSSVVVNAAANRYFEPGSGRSFWLTASLGLERANASN